MAYKIGGTVGQFGEYVKEKVVKPLVNVSKDVTPGGRVIESSAKKAGTGIESAAGRITQNPYQRPVSQDISNKAKSDYRFAGGEQFNPYTQGAGERLGGMNFDPYRRVATNTAQSSAQEMLAKAGALSGADRMKAFSDFNRQKILGTLQGAQKYDQAQSQNLMDVGRYNASRDMQVGQQNIGALNDAARLNAQMRLAREKNLYAGDVDQRNLDRKLEAAKLIAQSQMGGKSEDWWDPFGVFPSSIRDLRL